MVWLIAYVGTVLLMVLFLYSAGQCSDPKRIQEDESGEDRR